MDEAQSVVETSQSQPEATIEERIGNLLKSEIEPQKEEKEPDADLSVESDNEESEQSLDETPDAESGEAEEDAEPEFETVHIGDKSYDVPPDVAKAVMRHSDFMRRQSGVEARERDVEQLHQIAHLKAQTYAQMEDVVGDIRNLKLVIQGAEQGTNWSHLEATDPIEANTLRLKIIDAKQRLQNLVEHKSSAEAQIEQAEAGYRAKLTEEGHKVLSAKIKGWGPELSVKLFNFAVSHYGFTQQQAANVLDPRNVQMLYDNYQYHQGQKAANSKANLEGKRIPPTTPTMRPGSTPNKANVAQMKRYGEDRARLKQTGSVEDLARLIRIS